jgi:hypothetical protein
MLDGYADVVEFINDFKTKRIVFPEFKNRVLSRASGIGVDLSFDGDWDDTLDWWLEMIEFCYPEEDWYDLGCSLGDFLLFAIREAPRPLQLSRNDRVIREDLATREK